MKRKFFDIIYNHLNRDEFSILTGARQIGKTTLLKKIHEQCISEKKISNFITFEDPDILSAINTHPENVFRFTNPLSRNNDKLYLFIDEIQYAENPTNFLKYLYDKYNSQLKIIATGSSAFYIDRNFKDSLAGRKKVFEMYPLDFEEFLLIKGYDELTKDYLSYKTRDSQKSVRQLELLFDEYLTFGGYPKVATEKDKNYKIDYLQDYVSSYIKRDAIESHISDFSKFHSLCKLLANNTGGLININELSKTLKLSAVTIENYLYILQKCFHIDLVRPFHQNLSKELTKMPKIYFNDLGIRNALLKYYQSPADRIDKGALCENYAFIRLRYQYNTDDIHFWRTTDGAEVDFIIDSDENKKSAIEIKFNDNDFYLSKYKKFTETYSNIPLSCKAYESTKRANRFMAW